MKRILLLLSFLTFGICASGQLRTDPIDRLDWHNPWIGSGNMSGLTFNSFLSEDKAALTEASLGAQYGWGGFRNVFDPEKSIDADLNIESFSKLKNTYLYGRFGYGYEFDRGNQWRGTLHPYDMPFMLVDNVPGNITDETYTMEAGFGYRSGNLSIGVDVSYDVGIMAKLKDLRNRNTDMVFRIAPGISYDFGPVRLGLNAGYGKGSEKVEYTQVADNTENYLYYIHGMWLFNSYGYTSAETSRYTEGNTVFCNFQIDAEAGDWRVFNNAGMEYRTSAQAETGYNNLRYGDVKSLALSDRLTVQYAENHRITACFESKQMSADRYLQQQELDPASSIRRWVNYGSPQLCWSSRSTVASLEYHYRNPMKWEVRAGASYSSRGQAYDSFPLTFSQEFSGIEPHLGYTQFLYGKKTRWELSPELSYRFMTKVVRNDVTSPSDIRYESSGELQLLEPLGVEADFFGLDRLGASLRITCDFWRMYVSAGYSCFRAASIGENRHAAMLKIGLAF